MHYCTSSKPLLSREYLNVASLVFVLHHITLSAVLNVLYGVMSTPASGKMLILTTNDMSKLDPASSLVPSSH